MIGGESTMDQILLPAMRADLRLFKGSGEADGSPMWMLFDPVRNRYFHLHVRGLRVLRHWRTGATPEEIAESASDHGVEVDAEDVTGVARFLVSNGLTEARTSADSARLEEQWSQNRTHWYQWLLHRYLFIRVPLVRPDPFLARNLNRVRFIGSRLFAKLTLLLGLIGIILALRQWDAFTGTFMRFLNWEGVAWFALALIGVKTAHELGHAFVARHFGCRVPSMGVAFLVLFPVLYTDATDTWRIANPRDRLQVALAGVKTELAIALLATFAWSFLPSGGLRDAVFFLATTSWVTSLLINISPFMRFDGYHALSDVWGIHNLQPRAFELARWQLRETLFGFGEAPPEIFRPRRRRLLVTYAVATWIYRFFLFLGIALLIYHFAFKALGIVLFFIEIGWFIVRPVLQEMSTVIRHQWGWNKRVVRTIIVSAFILGLLLVPWRSTLPLPAVLEASSYSRVHPPEPARIVSVSVSSGDDVAKGDVLVDLEKPSLTMEVEKARHRIAVIQARLDRRAGSFQDLASEGTLRRQLAEQRVRLSGLQERIAALVVRSPLAGKVASLADLSPGQWMGRDQLLAEVIGQTGIQVTAYVSEQQRSRIQVGAEGRFISDDGTHQAVNVKVVAVEEMGSDRLSHLSLASTYGGPLAVKQNGAEGAPALEEGVYRVRLVATERHIATAWQLSGRASIEAPAESLLGRFFRYAAAVLIRESGF
ncbi:MAG: hypothetical protein CBD74_08730 [Saprospirales bacterium TMED214]|nr:MAG: hypothetical protein CBD74_08730 [Saprospirales bacterium TMED214]